MNSNIFYNASLKLSSLYLIIIMCISLIFSVGFYQVASGELERGIRRQPGPVSQLFKTRNTDLLQDLRQEQDEAVAIAKARLQASLLFINLFIFVGGGMLSYYLARRTLKPIEDIHEAQSRFTADASHELRTPIAAMRLENEIALTDDSLTLRKAKQQLQSNIEELDKLTSLSEGLLQLARLDNDTLQKSNTKVVQIVQSAVERVIGNAEAKKQIIKTKKIDKGTISVNENATIEALVTILDNAIKYSPEKSEIIVETNRTKTQIDFSVTDKGIGISPIDQTLIFDRFYRADNSRQKNDTPGYGIGLSIAKSVVESHGGSISVKSTVGKGSKFTLTFPVN
jgi:two-component system, OmpR family, sensor histidine kinase CiaH